jgi:hypothetical protein
MAQNFPGWKPIKIKNYRVLAERHDQTEMS